MVLEDSLDDVHEAQKSMKQYLELADTPDLVTAKKLIQLSTEDRTSTFERN